MKMLEHQASARTYATTIYQMALYTLLYPFTKLLWSVSPHFRRAFRSNVGIELPAPHNLIQASAIASTAVEVIIAFIVAMIAFLIGVNLIAPVATAVGGALNNKNLTGAANSLTAQLTLIFVTIVILGGVVFLALLGKKAGQEA